MNRNSQLISAFCELGIEMFPFLLFALIFCFARDANASEKLEISPDGRYVELNDAPFPWLADTAWDILYKLDAPSTATYLDARKSQGFNVVILQVLGGDPRARNIEGHGVFNFDKAGSPLVGQYDAAFISRARAMIKAANDKGFVVVVLPTWGVNVSKGLFNAETARDYGREMARQFGSLDVVWLLGGDTIPSKADTFVWTAMGLGIRESEPKHNLMSFHPAGGTSSTWFENSDLFDFYGIQSGHSRLRPLVKSISGIVRHDYALDRRRPVIDLESGYENIADGLERLHPGNQAVKPDDRLNDYDIRVRAYQTLFSGAFGYTYGALDVARFFSPGARLRWPPNDRWADAMRYPGANQLRYYQQLRAIAGNSFLHPDDALVEDNRKMGDYYRTLSACDADQSVCFVYSTSGDPVRVKKPILRTAELKWFDPRTGKFYSQSVDPSSVYQPPEAAAHPRGDKRLGTGQDWVLVISHGLGQ